MSILEADKLMVRPAGTKRSFQPARMIAGAVALFVVIVLLVAARSLVAHLDAKDMMVIQYPNGRLRVCTEPGYYGQWFGSMTKYQRRSQYSFSAKKDQGTATDESLPLMFNDGGGARISGVLSWEMPTGTGQIIKLHTLYGSQKAVEQQLVRPAVERAVYLTGPLMSSAEAYSARKADLLRFFEDQIRNGVYQMETISIKQPDPITGVEKTVQVVQIALDKNGQPKRQSSSQINEFGIQLLSPAIDNVDFEDKVKQQIATQQANYMQIQTAKAEALRAEQAAITAQKNGEAEAAKAKWDQEVVKAKLVTEAEARKAVAMLDVQTAELRKKELQLQGEGEAAKRRAIMAADGALDKKLETYQTVMHDAFEAVKGYQGPWVPSVVSGGAASQNGALSMMEALNIKALRDLGLDMSVPRTASNK
jgi:hypothetical protein